MNNHDVSKHLYFAEHFDVDPQVLRDYGAFNICIASDLPLFIDPFLLFNSDKPEYRQLHDGIIAYLRFLRSKADVDLSPGLIDAWYRFKEVKQNWLGFTVLGNDGSGLGRKFAVALNSALGTILDNIGEETITESTHLEKLALIQDRVGRDNISDFTTNLIKGYLAEYTQTFAKKYLDPSRCEVFAVERARFNYDTETWETRRYLLPRLGDDYVLLTPSDLLTCGETWIAHAGMLRDFRSLPAAVPNAELRAQINNYFRSQLGKSPTRAKEKEAAQKTVNAYPELIDYYIRSRENLGADATVTSRLRTDAAFELLVKQLKSAIDDLQARTSFYTTPCTSYDEALQRVRDFKDYIEHNDGYRVINRGKLPKAHEHEVQIFFGLIWRYSQFDVNREPNNGRGPVDFKVSYGSGDKSLIEFKLAANTKLRQNLENQVEIYQKANRTSKAIKVIICYTAADQRKVAKILTELELQHEPSVVVIDARADNKPSASNA
ncbi:hypothetical protein ACQP1O_33105 [Nocardia sp. CA-151230]|uniref:hypothetical protein n=1 Tax=Nocardia sp. CA-151230 TaxID=3239982 RepID=UPI003D8E207B